MEVEVLIKYGIIFEFLEYDNLLIHYLIRFNTKLKRFKNMKEREREGVSDGME